MAVTINGLNAAQPPAKTLHPEVKVEQVEVFGRLRMTRAQIASWYGLTSSQVGALFRRQDLKAAYDRGRAETIVALRQKQLELALKGNVQMLIHTGLQFADQVKDGDQPEVQDFEPTRFSWEAEMQERVSRARKMIDVTPDPEDDD